MEHLKVSNLSDDFQHGKVEMSYPAIVLGDVGEELALIVSCLSEGELPIVVKHKGRNIQLDKKIADSALNVNKLLKVYNFGLAVSPTNTVEITGIEDYLEVYPWTH
jgi:hypothetical protein